MSVNYEVIYPLLKHLEERGHIAPIARESGDAGPSRTIYAITPPERDRWRGGRECSNTPRIAE
ncbi:helix-turn-helix transcriptional regulator [Laspinema sp. D1]|uniref:Helix-turn-helix transcriptional regulator n=1 Tax=Laspinema palackyanum D2a TaxID=2953684 RepID=A0ABT2MUL8_9CYAN|nr:helix-turn-helix transcriptional regulator [Laspinema sp. D2a]